MGDFPKFGHIYGCISLMLMREMADITFKSPIVISIMYCDAIIMYHILV